MCKKNQVEILELKSTKQTKFTRGIQQQMWAVRRKNQQTSRYINWDGSVWGVERKKNEKWTAPKRPMEQYWEYQYVLNGGPRENGTEKIFEEIMVKNFDHYLWERWI